MKSVINFLTKKGYKQVDWNKCPKGYRESNYLCFSKDGYNIWCELYITDSIPYGWIVGTMTTFRGKFFYTLTELKTILK